MARVRRLMVLSWDWSPSTDLPRASVRMQPKGVVSRGGGQGAHAEPHRPLVVAFRHVPEALRSRSGQDEPLRGPPHSGGPSPALRSLTRRSVYKVCSPGLGRPISLASREGSPRTGADVRLGPGIESACPVTCCPVTSTCVGILSNFNNHSFIRDNKCPPSGALAKWLV